MMGLLDHAEYELKLAGYNIKNKKKIESSQDYADQCGRAAYDLLKLFASQGHSGMSAQFTLQIFNRLANHKPLTDNLSDNPEEWEDVSEYKNEPKGTSFQSKRNSSCFSYDGLKTYYDMDDPENNIEELDDNGKPTGYVSLKPRDQRKWVETIHYVKA